MKELIIGDIHNKVDLVNKILKDKESEYDNIIFLGDFFDDYNDNINDAERVAYWLKESLEKKNRIHLWGNHDFHYFLYFCKSVRGSGFSKNKGDAINKILKKEDWDKILWFYESQGFIFSHAGFNRSLLHSINGW